MTNLFAKINTLQYLLEEGEGGILRKLASHTNH